MTDPVPYRRWAFRMEPNNNWFDSYVEHQYESPDITILTDTEDAMPNVQFFASPHLDCFELPPMPQSGDREENIAISNVRENIRRRLSNRASALKLIFDGAFYVGRLGSYSPIDWSGLFSLPHWRRESWEPGNTMVDPFDRKVVGSRVLSPVDFNRISHLEDRLIFVARYDKVTLSMLRALGHSGPSFVTLHNLLDTMSTGGWGRAEVADAAEVNKDQVSRVIATANNFGALGVDARHGDLGQKAYSDPIGLIEAQEIVLKAVSAFITHRARLASQGGTTPF